MKDNDMKNIQIIATFPIAKRFVYVGSENGDIVSQMEKLTYGDIAHMIGRGVNEIEMRNKEAAHATEFVIRVMAEYFRRREGFPYPDEMITELVDVLNQFKRHDNPSAALNPDEFGILLANMVNMMFITREEFDSPEEFCAALGAKVFKELEEDEKDEDEDEKE